MKKSDTRGTLLITLITLVALVVIASVTCPDKVKHTNALSDKMSSIIADKTRDDESGLAGLGMLLGNAVSDAVIKNLVSVDDYFLFSLGKVYLLSNLFMRLLIAARRLAVASVSTSHELPLFTSTSPSHALSGSLSLGTSTSSSLSISRTATSSPSLSMIVILPVPFRPDRKFFAVGLYNYSTAEIGTINLVCILCYPFQSYITGMPVRVALAA